MIDDKELIERLLDWPYQGETMAGEAADRIEALEAKLAECEARLGKAVEALSDLMMHEPDYPDTIWEQARAAIAEIKGGNDAKSDL